MTTKIFHISKYNDLSNGKFYCKESLYNELPEEMTVLNEASGEELGVMTKDEFIALLEESCTQYGFSATDQGDFSFLGKEWTYVFSTNLY